LRPSFSLSTVTLQARGTRIRTLSWKLTRSSASLWATRSSAVGSGAKPPRLSQAATARAMVSRCGSSAGVTGQRSTSSLRCVPPSASSRVHTISAPSPARSGIATSALSSASRAVRTCAATPVSSR
jgi:hypothetical protein